MTTKTNGDEDLKHRRRIELEDKAKVVASARGIVELNRLIQKDRGKTAGAARILSLNPTRRPSPCLLIKSFFYDLKGLCQNLLDTFFLS